ncbi:MAG: TerB family tellurite resistance protein [Bacteroidota bacterium]
MLVQLARVDGVVVKEEIDLIKRIGKENGMSDEEISECFEDPSVVDGLDQLSEDQRCSHLYDIVQLMKVDGRIYKEEIKYCARIASRLGYEEEVLKKLMLKIYSDPHMNTTKELLRSTIQMYRKK